MVEKSSVPVPEIVSPEDMKRLDQMDRECEADFAIIDEARHAFRDVPDDEIERETDRILTRVRAEMRAEREHTASHS